MTKEKSPETTAVAPAQQNFLYGAIGAITAAMSAAGIGKDRKNDQQKYFFRGIDDVLNALASEYVRNKIVVLPSYSGRVMTEYKSNDGKRLVNVVLEGRFTIKSLVDGAELQVGPFIGEAMDSADKATNKAMSASYKYFAIQTFAIPTEGDNDADATTYSVRPTDEATSTGSAAASAGPAVVAAAPQVAGPESVAAALKRLVKNPENQKKLTAKLLQAYNVVMLDQIPDDRVKEAVSKIEAYLAAQKKPKPAAEPAAEPAAA